ncbi:MAG: PEGA domain-containing protein [Verrucomicrobia bacterium]|nr:PEGA domain-containing protein [Verrucomicrobiota bacterium]
MKIITPIAFAALVGASMLASGCASIVKGTTQEIPIASEPAGARVSVDGNPAGTTPTKAVLSRKQNHMVTLEKEGYETENVAVTKSIGGAVAGNIIAGGLVGWGVDAMTGAQYNLHPETVNIRLRPVVAAAGGSKSNQQTKEFIEELNKLDDLLVQKKVSPEEYSKMRAALVDKYQK